MAKRTPAQIEKLKKIKEEKDAVRAETIVSLGLRDAVWAKYKALECKNKVRVRRIRDYYDSRIYKLLRKVERLEKDKDLRINAVVAPEKTLIREHSEHVKAVRELKGRWEELTRQVANMELVMYCPHCGQEKAK